MKNCGIYNMTQLLYAVTSTQVSELVMLVVGMAPELTSGALKISYC